MPPKIAIILKNCVACGCCAEECPHSAVRVARGIRAAVDEKRCEGCGICEAICPAGAITMDQRDGVGEARNEVQ